jgi:hypothetical protein
MDSNFLRSCRSGPITQESIDKCFQERGHATPDMHEKCFICGYKFTDEELDKLADDNRRSNLKLMRR